MPEHRIVMIADCDHADIEIEKKVLSDVCRELPWHQCRSEEEVIAQCADAEGLILQYAPMTRRVLQSLKHCKVLVRYGVGVDTVDLPAASDLGIVVSNVPDYGTDEVSDHAFALMLCLTRKVAQANALVKDGVWDFRRSQPIFRHRGRTIGIVGAGRIGQAMARKAQALGMRTLAFDTLLTQERLPSDIRLVDLQTLLRESDVVSVHCPLTEETRNLLDESRLRLMKPTAYLVNTARGHIVDEAALDKLLSERRLAGAAFDVLAQEPGAAGHPLFRHDNFLCTPHMAWHSDESVQDLKRKAAEEVRRVLRGEAPHYQVNAF